MIITTRLVIFVSKPQLNVQSTAAKFKKKILVQSTVQSTAFFLI
jgi:hypothetical protein